MLYIKYIRIQKCSNKKFNKIFTKKFIVDKNRKISISTLYYAQRIKELKLTIKTQQKIVEKVAANQQPYIFHAVWNRVVQNHTDGKKQKKGIIMAGILCRMFRMDISEIINGMETALNKKIEDELNATILKIQKEYKADVIGVAEYLNKYHNKLWMEVENDWEEIFSNADITAEVKVNIKRRGLTK